MDLLKARSIRSKLNWVVLLTTFVALSLAGLAMVVFDMTSYQKTWEADLRSQADLVGLATAPALSFNDKRAAIENLALLKVRPNINDATVYDATGRVFAGYSREGLAPEPLPSVVEKGVHVVDGNLVIIMPIVNNGEHLGFILLRAHHERLDRLKKYLTVMCVVLAASMALAFLLSNRLVSVVTRPIQDVSDVARRITAGRDYSLRATRTTDDEVGQVVDAFNEMLGELAARAQTLEDAHQETLDLNAQLEDRVRVRTAELEAANRELEAFSYSASHDLRSPLHTIDSFSTLLAQSAGGKLDTRSQHYLDRIRANARRMTELIDALLTLAHVSRANLERQRIDLGALAETAIEQCRERDPDRTVHIEVDPDMTALGDPALMNQVIANLVGNAWKFTSKVPDADIRIGRAKGADGSSTFYVQDNGAGFDMEYSNRLFSAFQRLHTPAEFQGTGIGLATVHRIVTRHEGRIWAEAEPGKGATFYFTLGGG